MIPLLIIYIIPITVGIIGGRYLGRIANFLLILETFELDTTIMVLANTGRFQPALLIPFAASLQGVSIGGFLPPLVFLLVAIVGSKRSR